MSTNTKIYLNFILLGLSITSTYFLCQFLPDLPGFEFAGVAVSFIFLCTLFLQVYYSVLKPLGKLNLSSEKYLNDPTRWRLKVNEKSLIYPTHQLLELLIQDFQKASSFIQEIERGNLEIKFKEDEAENILAKNELAYSLTSLRDKLKTVEDEEEKRNWASGGLAMFVEILQSHQKDLHSLCDKITIEIAKYLQVNQSWLYIVNQHDNKKSYLKLTSCYAWSRLKYVKKEIEIGEGLAGQALFEKQTIHITQVPEEYAFINSGTGEANPRSILIIPLKMNDEILGVLELASFTVFKPYQIEFLEKLGENIASSISTIKVTETTQSLLERSQAQTEELKAQEEELRQNMEELQATQEKLISEKEEQDKLKEELMKEQSLFNAFLNSTNDLIYFKNLKCEFIRVSESLAKHFKTDKSEELIGKSDFDFHGAEHANKAFNDEQKIIKTGESMLNMVEKEVFEDGVVWSHSSKLPLKNQNGEIMGIFGISRNITDRILAEEKLEKEKKMLDVFMANTPHLVYFKDYEGKFTRISKAFADLLGIKSPEEAIGKTDSDFFETEAVRESLKKDEQVRKSGKPIRNLLKMKMSKKSQSVEVLSYKFPIPSNNGKPAGIFGILELADENLEVEVKGVSPKINK